LVESWKQYNIIEEPEHNFMDEMERRRMMMEEEETVHCACSIF
jgi:hypothetical protein